MAVRSPGGEVAFLVEHGIVRQADLAVGTGYAALGHDGGRVVDGLPLRQRHAYQGTDAQVGFGDLQQRVPAPGDEVVLEQQVFRWIAGDDQFGEGDDVGAGLRRRPRALDDQGGIGLKGPYRRVDLREGDPHRRIPGRERGGAHRADSSTPISSSVFAFSSSGSARVSTLSLTTGSVFDVRTLKRHCGILDAHAIGLVHPQRGGRIALAYGLQSPRGVAQASG